MAASVEYIQSRLDKKKAAIIERAAKTMKHAKRYLKNKAKKTAKELEWDCSFSDMKESAMKLRYLIAEKKGIERELADAIKNQVILPEALANYQKELAESFKLSRIDNRDTLKSIWEKKHEANYHIAYDIFSKFVDYKYRSSFRYNYKTDEHILKEGYCIEDCDKEDYDKFVKYNKACAFKKAYGDTMAETDESIEKRSNRDSKALVEDLYTRTKVYVGEATDFHGLRVSRDNRGYAIINGTVIGTEGKCRIESISAGGWNIQCWHIRVLVHAFN